MVFKPFVSTLIAEEKRPVAIPCGQIRIAQLCVDRCALEVCDQVIGEPEETFCQDASFLQEVYGFVIRIAVHGSRCDMTESLEKVDRLFIFAGARLFSSPIKLSIFDLLPVRRKSSFRDLIGQCHLLLRTEPTRASFIKAIKARCCRSQVRVF
jgi:hypothetical protein